MNKHLIFAAIIIVSTLSVVSEPKIFAAEQDEESVRAATKQFYSALNTMFTGDLILMKEVWSHQEDVTYMGPDGSYQIGWKKTLANWEKQAAMKLGGKVEPTEMRITVGPKLAVVHTLERGKNMSKDGKPTKVSIRATNVFRKENGKWKMIGHHTDKLPFLDK